MPRFPGKVFLAEPGTEAAQQEVLDLIAATSRGISRRSSRTRFGAKT